MTRVEDHIANLLYPLTDFYASAGRATPRIEAVEGSRVPQPYRSLLVHDSDMTPTLERYCGYTIHLKPLQVRQVNGALYRQVLLIVDKGDWPIEFGAIRIDLTRFDAEPRRLIVESRLPLGTILNRYQVPHFSRPSAFFAVEPDAVITEALGLEGSPTLYGRHNVIYGRGDEPLAEVVEILPPLPARSDIDDA